MNNYQKALIEEHSQLVINVCALHNYVYSGKSANDDRIEFANKCVQLAAMKKYEEALRARLENTGIVCEDGRYLEPVADITSATLDSVSEPIPTKMPKKGSDFDVDTNVSDE